MVNHRAEIISMQMILYAACMHDKYIEDNVCEWNSSYGDKDQTIHSPQDYIIRFLAFKVLYAKRTAYDVNNKMSGLIASRELV